jgi:hypothetical protein
MEVTSDPLKCYGNFVSLLPHTESKNDMNEFPILSVESFHFLSRIVSQRLLPTEQIETGNVIFLNTEKVHFLRKILSLVSLSRIYFLSGFVTTYVLTSIYHLLRIGKSSVYLVP